MMNYIMDKKKFFLIFIVLTTILFTLSGQAANKSVGSNSKNQKISLAEVEPELIYAFRRYSKFYGDQNTIQGDLLQRSYVFGSLGGFRNKLVDHGLFIDADVTQFLAANLTGGARSGPVRYNGSADYFLTFDTGKAGLWSGGLLMAHGETSWQANRSINPDVGSLLPACFDAAMPVPNESYTTLSELYFVQALPANIIILAGKINFSGLADQNVFANNERTQFGYTGLVNNPILGAFVPYTPLGAGFVWAPNKEHTLAIVALDADGNVTRTGSDTVFNGNSVIGVQYQFSPTVCGKLPGNYRILYGYTSKPATSFAVDPRRLIGELLGEVPVETKPNNYGIMVNFDQYLWVRKESAASYHQRLAASNYPGVARHHLPPEGIGIFARAGWAPSDRNVIDQFFSFGIGGYGMIFPNRPYDQWGIGYAGTHISADLRGDVSLLGENVRVFESAVELFYNFQITPATHLTLNAQFIRSPVPARDTAFDVGSRLQVDI